MSNYSKGVISIPEVTGDIVITVTTEGQAVNLFDPTKATYNARLKSSGVLGSGVPGIVVTEPIDIREISTLTVSGITEVSYTGLAYYACICTYSDADAASKVHLRTYTEETYLFDVASIKAENPNSNYMRLSFALKDNEAISAADTANLTIYGS